MPLIDTSVPPTTPLRTVARIALSGALVFSGSSYLVWGAQGFPSAGPTIDPWGPDGVVMASGGVEIVLGVGFAVPPRDRVRIGRLLAAIFVAVFPGNIAQYRNKRDASGLDIDRRRFARLLFQPVLAAGALWSTAVPKGRWTAASAAAFLDRVGRVPASGPPMDLAFALGPNFGQKYSEMTFIAH